MVKRLVLVLGDQLTMDLSALREADRSRDAVVMAEVHDEASYAWHHKKKIAFIFSAMRHFAEALRDDGWEVLYSRYDDAETGRSICAELMRRTRETGAEEVLATRCGEWRLREALENCPVKIRVLPDDRFIASAEEFAGWAEGRKQLRMEYFYREMRRKTGLLMEDGEPEGGEWNYDKENRKPAEPDLFMPKPMRHAHDDITEEVLALVRREFAENPGDLNDFWFAVDRRGARRAASKFMKEALPRFGDYQDAMLTGEDFLYHSVLSVYLNAGLLDPLELCAQAAAAYAAGDAPLNAVEGYIRQILGWREFVRGVYDLKGPEYGEGNFLGAERDLPDFYWTGETEMACLREAIGQTLREGYAHHIQRLMVTGTFALLAGVRPQAVHEWYLAIYADAYEWVELPNTFGMSQFADGGVVGSKPYAASGVYIDRMSDHCAGCKYDVKQKTGEGACPFNPLYWDFLIRNRAKLEDNPRMGQMYRTWERMDEDRQEASLDSARAVLAGL
ncbi:cryptochrome/photolyase family protein [Algicella marina]|uniref:Cryptochrome/photolyase family protein n=1 Tax=Algicella marina TaxID=2683284 RepID=A0A6P1T0Z7_9RHOB|nr:cryptochrome/photolyase family protein [Algicella marina]QHQ35490.1 cryptochrome/photolyase family protein [Algicella marina]